MQKEQECQCGHSISAESHKVPVLVYRLARKGGMAAHLL
jgi:hypothetical protein